jgi:ankyrin repeat protein
LNQNKILTDLFNADIIKLNKNKMSENQLTILQMKLKSNDSDKFNEFKTALNNRVKFKYQAFDMTRKSKY